MRLASILLLAVGLPATLGTGPALARDPPPPHMTAKAAARKWGRAVECKAVPDLPTLPSPEVTISLDGLSLHLVDAQAGFDHVYPIGVGAIYHGRTLTESSAEAPKGRYRARLDEPAILDKPEPAIRWAWNYACRFWWRDPALKELVPVYAGLPFIRLESPGFSNDGIHGPAEDVRREDGGRLRRGYVSHGCIRMEPAGILDVYARTRGRAFPVRIQREVERRADGTAVDVAERWLLSECTKDADCNFDGGTCRKNRFAGHGFCTTACEGRCPARAGDPGSFCAADPDAPGQGFCTVRASDFDNQCKRFAGFVRRPGVKAFKGGRTKAAVCLPGGTTVALVNPR